MIRYDKKLNREIYNIVNRFNAKVRKLETENNKLLPSEITTRELKAEYQNRKELRKKLNQMRRFLKTDATDIITTNTGLQMTKWEKQNLAIELRTTTARLTRQIKKFESSPIKLFGKKQSITQAQFQDSEYLNLKARRETLRRQYSNLSSSTIEAFKNLLIYTKTEYINPAFKSNYLEMIIDNAFFYNVDNKQVKNIIDKLSKLNAVEFKKLFQEEKSLQAIIDYYLSMQIKGLDYDQASNDVNDLFTNLNENLDSILKDYM